MDRLSADRPNHRILRGNTVPTHWAKLNLEVPAVRATTVAARGALGVQSGSGIFGLSPGLVEDRKLTEDAAGP